MMCKNEGNHTKSLFSFIRMTKNKKLYSLLVFTAITKRKYILFNNKKNKKNKNKVHSCLLARSHFIKMETINRHKIFAPTGDSCQDSGAIQTPGVRSQQHMQTVRFG
jgi:hypothetical protein